MKDTITMKLETYSEDIKKAREDGEKRARKEFLKDELGFLEMLQRGNNQGRLEYIRLRLIWLNQTLEGKK